RCDRHAEYSHSSRGAQRSISLLPACAAQRIDCQLYALTVCKFNQDRQPILIAIVDCVIETALLQKLMFGGTGRTVSRRADVFRNVQSRESDAAAGVVNQHSFAFFQTT